MLISLPNKVAQPNKNYTIGEKEYLRNQIRAYLNNITCLEIRKFDRDGGTLRGFKHLDECLIRDELELVDKPLEKFNKNYDIILNHFFPSEKLGASYFDTYNLDDILTHKLMDKVEKKYFKNELKTVESAIEDLEKDNKLKMEMNLLMNEIEKVLTGLIDKNVLQNLEKAISFLKSRDDSAVVRAFLGIMNTRYSICLMAEEEFKKMNSKNYLETLANKLKRNGLLLLSPNYYFEPEWGDDLTSKNMAYCGTFHSNQFTRGVMVYQKK